MESLRPALRQALGDKLRTCKADIAERITDQFFAQHPEWRERFNEAGRKACLEDAHYHVDFLASSITAGSPDAFKTYVQWLCNMLSTRNVPSECVTESLELLGAALDRYLDEYECRLVREYLAGGLKAIGTQAIGETDRSESPLLMTQQLYLQAILSGQRKAAVNIALEALRAGAPVQDIYVEVLQESLYEVGRRWESNQITVADEHLATAITQFVVGQLYAQIEPHPQTRGVAIVTGVQGEMHQVGANMVADMMDIDGWDVHFLGTNLPHDGILRAVRENKPNLLGISSTMLFNMPQVIHLIQAARAEFGEAAPRIIVGGGAFRQATGLWREIGADGYAPDLRSALIACQPQPPPSNS